MPTTTSIRLSDTLVVQAHREAGIFNRTLSGQIEYWVRLGRAVEAVPGFDMRRVRAALGGQLLSRDERLRFEENLGDALAAPSASSMATMRELREAGAAVGLDGEGRLVCTMAGGGVEPIEGGQPQLQPADERA